MSTQTNLKPPPRAKMVGGVWLPETETHLEEWMTKSKRAREVDGKLTYQYHKLEAAMRHQPEGRRGTAIDVGAHVGLWSMWLTKWFDQVRAFEPCPAFWDLFELNVDMARCDLSRFGLGDTQKKVSIAVPLESTGATHVIGRSSDNAKFDPDGPMEQFDAWVTGLDAIWRQSVDFIKIDAEGWEPKIIRGAAATIKRYKPNLVVECKGNDMAYGERPEAAVKLLESWGMKPLEVISGDWIMGW